MARIARKFTRSTKIEIEMLEKNFARFLLGSKEDRKFYARDRSDRNSMLEMITRKLKLKLDEEKLKILALFSVVKMRKLCGFHTFVQNQYKNIPITCNILWKLVLTVDSALSCSKNVWFRSKYARFCSKFFSGLMLEIAR